MQTRGDTPNLAARLPVLAEPQSVVIAPATRWQIGDLFERADLGNQALMKPQFVAFALSLILVSAPAAKAQTDAGTEPCVTWHRFEPGLIVNGRRRQPTPREIEARMWDLLAWSNVGAGACAVAPPQC
jgi:hypothetical protein